jgi:hypothetical protein
MTLSMEYGQNGTVLSLLHVIHGVFEPKIGPFTSIILFVNIDLDSMDLGKDKI